jgi:hypothetical protein
MTVLNDVFKICTPYTSTTMTRSEVIKKFRLSDAAKRELSKLQQGKSLTVGQTKIMFLTKVED